VHLQLTSTGPYSSLLDLEWDRPLIAWNDPRLVKMVRGVSRHQVRFVEVAGRVFAVKEIDDRLAVREYTMLRQMAAADLPVVEAVGTVTGRTDHGGEALDGAIVTRYLDFALPYSYLLGREGSVESQHRLLDAAAVLLVRLHLDGFFWGDCSLNNILFRRDAGALSAYLVDSETAEHHEVLSRGQRGIDIGIAVENLTGGMMDLIAAERIDPYTDPEAFGARLEQRYEALWDELTRPEEVATDQRWRLDQRVRRINELGFDAAELSLVPGPEGRTLRIRPSIVEEGHHHRRLYRLTGLDVQENQARRLLNDLATYAATLEHEEGRTLSEAVAGYRWLAEVFEPFVAAIPPELAGRLEPAEAYHEYLEHRWYLSEAAGHPVDDQVATERFFRDVLARRPEERLVLPDMTGEVPIIDT
jgi:Domain of unknown function (DUF4032)/Lipopolysaccharide kinase (Kdo/WaaP) family